MPVFTARRLALIGDYAYSLSYKPNHRLALNGVGEYGREWIYWASETQLFTLKPSFKNIIFFWEVVAIFLIVCST